MCGLDHRRSAAAQMVLLLRLSPLVPFGLLNYMLGLTGIPALSFILCSWLGMLPGACTLGYVPCFVPLLMVHAQQHPLSAPPDCCG